MWLQLQSKYPQASYVISNTGLFKQATSIFVSKNYEKKNEMETQQTVNSENENFDDFF